MLVVFAENTGAESNNIPIVIVNGEGELIVKFHIEPRAWIFLILLSPQAGLHDLATGKASGARHLEEKIRVSWSPADKPFFGDFLGETS